MNFVREWRNQTVSIFSTKENVDALGSTVLPTGLTHPHPRLGTNNQMYKFHVATSSLFFHPTEMLLGIGGLDGRVRILGCNLGDWRVPDADEFGGRHQAHDELGVDGGHINGGGSNGRTSESSY